MALPAAGMNRGAAISGNNVFMATDNAHLIALNKTDGELLWETEVADWHKSYNITSAPLVVGNLVITGTTGGEHGLRGFVVALDKDTGKEVWRFWTVPAPGARRLRDMARQAGLSMAARPLGSPAYMTRKPTPSFGPQEIQVRITTAMTEVATISIQIAFWHWIQRQES